MPPCGLARKGIFRRTMESPSPSDKHNVESVHRRDHEIQADYPLSQSLKNDVIENDNKYANDYLAHQVALHIKMWTILKSHANKNLDGRAQPRMP